MEKYELLKRKLKGEKLKVDDIMYALKRSRTYAYARLSGEKPWLQDEMAIIMEMIGEPYSEVGRYFPVGGVHEVWEMPQRRQIHDRNLLYTRKRENFEMGGAR